jgi:hypothetical protein
VAEQKPWALVLEEQGPVQISNLQISRDEVRFLQPKEHSMPVLVNLIVTKKKGSGI